MNDHRLSRHRPHGWGDPLRDLHIANAALATDVGSEEVGKAYLVILAPFQFLRRSTDLKTCWGPCPERVEKAAQSQLGSKLS